MGSGRAFIIIPFGIKTGQAGEPLDFDRVKNSLIEPAIARLGLSGGTTQELLQEGDIKEDIFREIVLADIVIADVTVHNANVFYELGIRHALRESLTQLIRSDKGADKRAFDINTEKIMNYSYDNLGDSVDDLVTRIEESKLVAGRSSPVFRLMPEHKEVSVERFEILPPSFSDKVELAKTGKNLENLADLEQEVIGNFWEKAGLRVVGQAYFSLSEHEHSARTWEKIVHTSPDDVMACCRLSTSYQKLATKTTDESQKATELTRSDQFANRALENNGLSLWDRAELLSLLGSNQKFRWRNEFETRDSLAEMQKTALISFFLGDSTELYQQGYETHLSHYYSGVNYLALLKIRLELGKLHPDTWANILSHSTVEQEKAMLESKIVILAGSVDMAARNSVKHYSKESRGWDMVTLADIQLLTSDNPEKVKISYERCMQKVEGFTKDSLRNQLTLYESLDLFSANREAALAAFD